MSAWLGAVLAVGLGAASTETLPIGDLAGSWELVEAPRFDPNGAWPYGIENRRYVFEPDGRWFSLNADERLSRAKPIGSVERLAVDRVRFHTPEGKAPESEIRVRAEQLEIKHGEHGVWIYRRLTDPKAIEGPIPLQSLEVLEVDQRTSAAMMFDKYLELSQVRSSISDARLHGVWELVRVRGVPVEQRPEHGYYNDVLVVAPTHFCFIQRSSQNGAICADAEQDRRGRIQLKDDAGKYASSLQPSITASGHLELADGAFVQTFALVGRDPAGAPAVPLKIAIYRE